MKITTEDVLATFIVMVKDGRPIGNVAEIDTDTKWYRRILYPELDTEEGFYDRIVICPEQTNMLEEHVHLAREAGIEILSQEEMVAIREGRGEKV